MIAHTNARCPACGFFLRVDYSSLGRIVARLKCFKCYRRWSVTLRLRMSHGVGNMEVTNVVQVFRK